MTLTNLEKELIFVGASVAAGCKPCTEYHIKKAKKINVPDIEIRNSITIALDVRNQSRLNMGNYVEQLLYDKIFNSNPFVTKDSTILNELLYITSAFAVNSADLLQCHINSARSFGISEENIKFALDTSLFVKGKAEQHVNKIADEINTIVLSIQSVNKNNCGCSKNENNDIPNKLTKLSPKNDNPCC